MMEIRNLYHKGGSVADLRYNEKEQKSRSWEIVQKITCEEHTLDWSQSKVFLVMALKTNADKSNVDDKLQLMLNSK